MEAILRFSLIGCILLEKEFTLQTIQFRLVPPFSPCVYKCQRFCEHRESCLWLSHGSMCFGEERQKIRSQYLCSGSMPSHHTLVELLDPFLALSLECQCPAVQRRTVCDPCR